MPAPTYEVELDSRQRLPLARIVQGSQHRFRIETMPDGAMLVTPIVSVTERELAMLRNPAALASLSEGLDQAARGEGIRFEPGHFSKLASELGDDAED